MSSKILLSIFTFFLFSSLPAFAVEETPDYIAAMKEWQPKAEAGDAEAQFRIGQMYAFGHGFKQNIKEAFNWYKKSAEQGYAQGRTALALVYLWGNDYIGGKEADFAEAQIWLEKAAAQDDPAAQYWLGYLAEIKKDYQEARKWWDQAAAQGYSYAMTQIGATYEDGDGVAKDLKQAKEWYEKAAAQEKPDPEAMHKLAVMYRDGTGVKKDNGKAHEWWEKASQAGSLSALSTIAMGYYEGSMGYPKEIQKAVDYLERSADVGNYDAASLLVLIYDEGEEGVPSNVDNAMLWSKRIDDRQYWRKIFLLRSLKNL